MTKEKVEQIRSDAMNYQGDEDDGGPEYYTAGATVEATKAEGLVKALEAIVNTEIAPGDDPNEVLNDVAKIATAAMTAYQSSSNQK